MKINVHADSSARAVYKLPNIIQDGIRRGIDYSAPLLWERDGSRAAPNLQAPINPYPTAFPYGNGVVLHFYQQQESSTTKTVHKVINKGLKTYV